MIAQFTPLHRQAVEVMARVLWYQTYPGRVPCPDCAMSERGAFECYGGAALREVSIAALYLGHIEALNDRTLDEIVRAAEEAVNSECATGHGAGFDCAPCLLDRPAFFTAIVLEGIVRGEVECRTHGINLDFCRASAGCQDHSKTDPPIIVPVLRLDTEVA